MKKILKFIGLSFLIIVTLLVSNKFILAQPEAKKICFYPKNNGSDDIKLEALKPNQSVCFEDEETLKAFHSAKTMFYRFTMWHGGFVGTFIDKEDKMHLIRVCFTEGVIFDDSNNKVYIIEDEKMQRKWYDAVNITLSKIDSLK
jgi:hypothetical protein